MPRIDIDRARSIATAPGNEATVTTRQGSSPAVRTTSPGALADLVPMRRDSGGSPSTLAQMAPRVPSPPPLPDEVFKPRSRLELDPLRTNPRLQPDASNEGGARRGGAHLGRQDEKSGVFVGSGRWNGSDLPRTTRPNRTMPLQQHEVQQVAYQLASRVQGDPIEDPADSEHLANATAVVHRTRSDLKHGRGNIISDLVATDWASAARTQVAYDAGLVYGNNANTGVALAYGSGNCDHNAQINSRRYSVLLQNGSETVSSMLNMEIKHAWSQVDRPDQVLPGGGTAPRDSIVLDSWMDGPPVRLKDSSLASLVATTMRTEVFDRNVGVQNMQIMDRARHDAGSGGPLHEQSESALRRYMEEPPQYSPFPENSIVDGRFAYGAATALAKQSASTQELMAAVTARTAYNLNVREAARPATVSAIVDEAMRLHMPSRPPVVRPEDQA